MSVKDGAALANPSSCLRLRKVFFRDVREDILLWQPSEIQLLHEVLPKGLPKCRVLGDQHLILQS